MNSYMILNGDCRDLLDCHPPVTCIFADPPDNIALGYHSYEDKLDRDHYVSFLRELISNCARLADVFWLSFNPIWVLEVAEIVKMACGLHGRQFKDCVQVFTFGQYNPNDLGTNHRPLWRIMKPDAILYPENIKVPSWRERNGDKRAKPGGRVPGDVFDMQYPEPAFVRDRIGRWLSAALDDPQSCPEFKRDIEAWFETCNGDVFDFPRVTGNSAQRQDWCPTQLHEALVERCVLFSTDMGDTVLDPCMGSGTTLRVCLRNARLCTTFDTDAAYCSIAAQQNGLAKISPTTWARA
jgi:hypothetical protein